MSKVFGIDLGTTYSLASIMDLNDRALISHTDAQGSRKMVPSAVVYDEREDKILVGYPAFIRRGTKSNPVVSIKRAMGFNMETDIGPYKMTPQKISAKILEESVGKLRERVKDISSLALDRAVITVPAYFMNNQIKATVEAGQSANLEVVEILQEPVAAALYYSWKYNFQNSTFLVYDLGGGTFDVSVVKVIGGEAIVLGISGDNYLGGDDFDNRLAEYIRRTLVENKDFPYALNLDIGKNPEDKLKFTRLVMLAEGIKKELSRNEVVRANYQNLFTDKNGNNVVIDMEIKRSTFHGLIEGLVNKTIPCCEQALLEAQMNGGITPDKIDYILMVGGSTYIPIVREKVRKAFCKGQNHSQCTRDECRRIIIDDPEYAVSFGAAIRASSYGIDIHDERKQVVVSFCNPGGTNQETYNLSGRVRVQNSLATNIQKVRLTNREVGFSKNTTLHISQKEKQTTMGNFLFKDVQLQKNAINNLEISLLNNKDQVFTTFNRSIYQDKEFKPIGMLMPPAVIAKTIYLEVIKNNILSKEPIFEALTPITASGANRQYTFYTNDKAGFIRAPFYQEKQIIDILEVNIDKNLGVGTPVVFYLTIDKLHRITGYGEIGETDFRAEEFNSQLPVEKLCKSIKDDNYKISLRSNYNTIDWLNEILKVPNFYGIVCEKKLNSNFSKIVAELADKTKGCRDKSFFKLTSDEQNNIRRLNRYLLEEAYPGNTPKKGRFNLEIKTPDNIVFTREEYEKLCKDFEKFSQEKKQEFKDKKDKICKDINEAFFYDDRPMINYRGNELRELIKEIRQSDKTLAPPKEKFDALVEECLELGNLAKDALPSFDPDEWDNTVEKWQKKGDDAYRHRDQQMYGESFVALDLRKERLLECIQSKDFVDIPKFTQEELAGSLLEFLKWSVNELQDIVRVSGNEVIIQKLNEYARNISALKSVTAHEVVTEGYVIFKQLQDMKKQVENELMLGEKNIPKGTLRT